MRRPPHPPDESVLGQGLWQRVLRVGVVLTAAALVLGRWGMDAGKEWQSMVFVAMVSLQLGVAFGLRARQWTTQNPFLPVAAAGSLLLALAGLYVPALRDLLGTAPLPAADAALAVAIGALGWLAIRADRRLFGPRVAGVRVAPSGPSPASA